MANCLEKDSDQMRRIQKAVKEAGMFVVLGYSERDGASLYMAQAFISPEGEIVHNRRKIKPTHIERTLWGDGQADSLKCVVPSPFGRVGGLNCWEHLQPYDFLYPFLAPADPCAGSSDTMSTRSAFKYTLQVGLQNSVCQIQRSSHGCITKLGKQAKEHLSSWQLKARLSCLFRPRSSPLRIWPKTIF